MVFSVYGAFMLSHRTSWNAHPLIPFTLLPYFFFFTKTILSSGQQNLLYCQSSQVLKRLIWKKKKEKKNWLAHEIPFDQSMIRRSKWDVVHDVWNALEGQSNNWLWW